MEFIDFKDWLDLIFSGGTFIFAALTYFKGKNSRATPGTVVTSVY